MACRLLADARVRAQVPRLFQGGPCGGLVASAAAHETEGEPDALEVPGALRASAQNLDGLGGLAGVEEGQAQVIAGVGVARGEFQGTPVVGDGLGVALLAEQLVPGIIQLLRVGTGGGGGWGAGGEHLTLDEGGGRGRGGRLGRCLARRVRAGQISGRVAQVVIPGQGENGEAVEDQKDGEQGPMQGGQSGHGVREPMVGGLMRDDAMGSRPSSPVPGLTKGGVPQGYGSPRAA